MLRVDRMGDAPGKAGAGAGWPGRDTRPMGGSSLGAAPGVGPLELDIPAGSAGQSVTVRLNPPGWPLVCWRASFWRSGPPPRGASRNWSGVDGGGAARGLRVQAEGMRAEEAVRAEEAAG